MVRVRDEKMDWGSNWKWEAAPLAVFSDLTITHILVRCMGYGGCGPSSVWWFLLINNIDCPIWVRVIVIPLIRLIREAMNFPTKAWVRSWAWSKVWCSETQPRSFEFFANNPLTLVKQSVMNESLTNKGGVLDEPNGSEQKTTCEAWSVPDFQKQWVGEID